MTDRELLQQALDALESRCGTNADERKELIPAIRARLAQPVQKHHSLAPGEMELSLRREYDGELFELRYRFNNEQVLRGPEWLVENAAKKMSFNMNHMIKEYVK